MQALTFSYITNIMTNKNKRVDNLICLKDIPNKHLGDLSFEKDFDYDVLGIDPENETFILLNEWGEAEEVSIFDNRFKLNSYAEGKKYPTNFLLGIGMNKANKWHWFK